MNKENYFPGEKNEKSFGFKLIMGVIAVMILSFVIMGAGRLLTPPQPIIDPTLYVEPYWYTLSSTLLGIVALLGLVATYMFKKWGVYTVCIALLVLIIINPEFDLKRTLLPMFTLFCFVGYGFFEIIPKWKFFK